MTDLRQMLPGRTHLNSYGPARGGRLDANNPRGGVVDDGNIAYPERIEQARRMWTEARAEDFEQLDKRGRRWRDKASGTEYIRPSGAPLLSPGEESTRFISTFFIGGDGYLVFLQRADIDPVILGPKSFVHARAWGRQAPCPARGASNEQATPVVGDSSEEVLAG